LRHDSLLQKFSSCGDTADGIFALQRTVDFGSVRDKKTARGEANSATVEPGVPWRFKTKRKSHLPSESQTFLNDV
jgi:hypothetical protein